MREQYGLRVLELYRDFSTGVFVPHGWGIVLILSRNNEDAGGRSRENPRLQLQTNSPFSNQILQDARRVLRQSHVGSPFPIANGVDVITGTQVESPSDVGNTDVRAASNEPEQAALAEALLGHGASS